MRRGSGNGLAMENQERCMDETLLHQQGPRFLWVLVPALSWRLQATFSAGSGAVELDVLTLADKDHKVEQRIDRHMLVLGVPRGAADRGPAGLNFVLLTA